jgi:hypothetical protein
MPPFSSLLSCALVLALVSPQAPPREPPPGQNRPEPIRPTPLPGSQKEIDRQKKLLEGMWRLVELRDNQLAPGNRKEFAYCLITSDFLALELHIDWLNDRRAIEHRVFETGMYTYEVLEASRIEMKAMIGAVADGEGITRFRPAGFARRYRLELEPDRMIWVRDDGQRTVFERMQGPGARAKRDIYGRLIPEKPAAEKPTTDAPGSDSKPPAEKPPPKD